MERGAALLQASWLPPDDWTKKSQTHETGMTCHEHAVQAPTKTFLSPHTRTPSLMRCCASCETFGHVHEHKKKLQCHLPEVPLGPNKMFKFQTNSCVYLCLHLMPSHIVSVPPHLLSHFFGLLFVFVLFFPICCLHHFFLLSSLLLHIFFPCLAFFTRMSEEPVLSPPGTGKHNQGDTTMLRCDTTQTR